MKMKHSPSIAEILPNIGEMSDGGSMGPAGNEKNFKRGSQSRSPNRVMSHITDNEEESNANYRSLNSDNKHTRSNRKMKPI